MTPFHELLQAGARDHGDRPAVLFDGGCLTYSGLLDRAGRLAAGLRMRGVGGADHVAILMDNSLDCVLAWLASSLIGCTEVPVNTQYTGELLAYLLRDSGATVAICDARYLEALAAVAGGLPELRLVVARGDGPRPAGLDPVPLAECLGDGPPLRGEAGPGRIILYTSGTTGPSKGVVHTQDSMLTLSRYNAQMLDYGPADRLLNFFPLFHQNARYTGVIPALCSGASIRLQSRFSSSGFWALCRAEGITAFNYLGSVLRMILNVTPDGMGPQDHPVRKAFGAGAPPADWEACETRLGIRLVETYGLSEAPMATINIRGGAAEAPIGSAGKAGALFEIGIVDAADNLLPPGETGEVVLRPKRPDALMQGYHNKEAATIRAWRNLWFHSGDRGRLSPEGFLYFEARDKDAIRRRGENISAWEVESVLNAHPDVLESAVYGVESEETDEEVAAALVLGRGDADLRGILAFAAARLPGYAVPTLLRVMADLPRTPTAKVQKAELRRAGRADCIDCRTLRQA